MHGADGGTGDAAGGEGRETAWQSLGRALTALSAPAYMSDDRGIVLALNAALCDLLGLSEEEILGQDSHDLIHRNEHGEPVARSQCRLREASLGERTAQGGGVWVPHRDGSLTEVGWLTTAYDLGGPAAGSLVILHPLVTPEEEAAADLAALARGRAATASVTGTGGRTGSWSTRGRLQGRPFVEAVTPPGGETGTLTELERLALLAETTTLLTSTLDRDEALDRLMHLVVPRLADWVVIDLITEHDELIRYAVAHQDGPELTRRTELEGPMPPIPAESPMPLSRALRGAASSVAGPETYAGPPDAGIAVEQRRLFKATGMHSAVIAPIRGVRQVLGALTMGRRDQPREYVPSDVALLEDIARRAGLALDNARLYERQRAVGQTMQRYLLPQLPRVPGLEMTARYLPAPESSEVGGDWYDAFLAADGAMSLAIGDVVGHDLEAAAGMAQLRNMLRAYSWAQQQPPSRTVEWLDSAAMHFGEVTMATLICARLTGPVQIGGERPGTERTGAERTGGEPSGAEGQPYELSWTNAGHLPPLLVSREGVARYLTAGHGVLLGLGTHPERSDATAELPPGSTLILFTDGLVESPGRSLDEGLDRLRRHAASLAHRPLDPFIDLLLERSRPPRNEDDVAVLAVRIPDGRSASA